MSIDNIIKLAELDRSKPEWLHECLLGETGKPLGNLANVLLALRNDPGFQNMFGYDEMLCRPLRPERLCTPRKALFSVRPIGGGKFELLTLDSMVRAAKCKLICPRQWEAKHPLKLPAGI